MKRFGNFDHKEVRTRPFEQTEAGLTGSRQSESKQTGRVLVGHPDLPRAIAGHRSGPRPGRKCEEELGHAPLRRSRFGRPRVPTRAGSRSGARASRRAAAAKGPARAALRRAPRGTNRRRAPRSAREDRWRRRWAARSPAAGMPRGNSTRGGGGESKSIATLPSLAVASTTGRPRCCRRRAWPRRRRSPTSMATTSPSLPSHTWHRTPRRRGAGDRSEGRQARPSSSPRGRCRRNGSRSGARWRCRS